MLPALQRRNLSGAQFDMGGARATQGPLHSSATPTAPSRSFTRVRGWRPVLSAGEWLWLLVLALALVLSLSCSINPVVLCFALRGWPLVPSALLELEHCNKTSCSRAREEQEQEQEQGQELELEHPELPPPGRARADLPALPLAWLAGPPNPLIDVLSCPNKCLRLISEL